MKKLIAFVFLIACISTSTYSQVYLKEFIPSSKNATPRIEIESYLDDNDTPVGYKFFLTSNVGVSTKSDSRSSSSSSGSIMQNITFFEGTAAELNQFLNDVLNFAEKYKRENHAGTYMHGMKVEVLYETAILIYTKDGYYTSITQRNLSSYIKSLKKYCKKNDISLKMEEVIVNIEEEIDTITKPIAPKTSIKLISVEAANNNQNINTSNDEANEKTSSANIADDNNKTQKTEVKDAAENDLIKEN